MMRKYIFISFVCMNILIHIIIKNKISYLANETAISYCELDKL